MSNKLNDSKPPKKAWGRGLMIAGAITVLDCWTLVPVPLMGPWAIIVGAALIATGYVISYEPKRQPMTNEALLVASRHDNRLTVPILSLELGIDIEEADKVISDLIKAGVAELEMDSDVDNGFVYRVKGLT